MYCPPFPINLGFWVQPVGAYKLNMVSEPEFSSSNPGGRNLLNKIVADSYFPRLWSAAAFHVRRSIITLISTFAAFETFHARGSVEV